MPSVEITHAGISLAMVAVRDNDGRVVLELSYLTDSLARMARDQIQAALELSTDKSGSESNDQQKAGVPRPFLVRPPSGTGTG